LSKEYPNYNYSNMLKIGFNRWDYMIQHSYLQSIVCTISPQPNIQVIFILILGLRKTLIRGKVHDPTAYSFGGVAGHAGFFSNARNL